MIQVGDVLRGKYRLESSIGRGGMGEVFAAVDLASEKRVAVKVVSSAFVGELLMARLQREAIAAVRVRSEFVPQMIEVDTTEEGEVFLVMELLRGHTLGERLKQRGGYLPWEEVARIGEDVLRGLIDAHAAGVVHRDLKPSNIFLQPLAGPGGRERAKVLDFGVCKLDAPDGEKLTTTGESVGTVAYMAPEQIRGASKVDERADLYSFGTVVFEALSGRLAHDATGQMAMLASKLERTALMLRDATAVPLPAGLDHLVMRLLARNPVDRPRNATDVLAEWRALGPATTEPATLPVVDIRSQELLATQTSLTAGPMTRAGRSSSRLGKALAAFALAAAVVVLAVTLTWRGSAPAEAELVQSAGGVGLTPLATPTASAAEPATADDGKTAAQAGVEEAAPLVLELAPSALPRSAAHAKAPRFKAVVKRAGVTSLQAGSKKPGEPRISDTPRY